MWFGNINKFINPKIKIITIGLNPSNNEFPENDSVLRFPEAYDAFSKSNYNLVYECLNGYFDSNRCPYRKWFNAYEKVLKYLNCNDTYGEESNASLTDKNYAIHIDFFSAIATNPTYSGLTKKEKDQLIRIDLFARLFNFLVHTSSNHSPIIIFFNFKR